MPQVLEGRLDGTGKKFGIVVSRFNEFITGKLLSGALDGLVRHGVHDEDITVAWVPGSWETPLAVKKMAESGKYDAVLALGCVIRGATSHFDFIASEVSKGTAQIAMESGVPVVFGVLTPDTIEQAIERAGSKSGNKGFDAATGAIEMVNLLEQMAAQ